MVHCVRVLRLTDVDTPCQFCRTLTPPQSKLDSSQHQLDEALQTLAKSDKKYEILKQHFHGELEATKATLDHETAELAKVYICILKARVG